MDLPRNKFVMSIDSYALTLLPPAKRDPNSPDFPLAISKQLTEELSAFGAKARIIVGPEFIEIEWDPTSEIDIIGAAVQLLRSGSYRRGEYLKAIKVGDPAHWVHLAKTRRTELAQKVFHWGGGDLRPDVKLHITKSLKRCSKIRADEIKAVNMKIAILGQNGLDINHPDKKYTLRSILGTFSGYQLVAMMHTAFQQVASSTAVGIDFY
jgi:hypothetical protein